MSTMKKMRTVLATLWLETLVVERTLTTDSPWNYNKERFIEKRHVPTLHNKRRSAEDQNRRLLKDSSKHSTRFKELMVTKAKKSAKKLSNKELKKNNSKNRRRGKLKILKSQTQVRLVVEALEASSVAASAPSPKHHQVLSKTPKSLLR